MRDPLRIVYEWKVISLHFIIRSEMKNELNLVNYRYTLIASSSYSQMLQKQWASSPAKQMELP